MQQNEKNGRVYALSAFFFLLVVCIDEYDVSIQYMCI